MNYYKVDLIITAGNVDQFPEDNRPEISFIGRSNVGKSSLLNRLVNRKKIARTSNTPGKTRTINFYLVSNEYYYVDLPGYGYAAVGGQEREKWKKTIEKYLTTREQLKLAIVLLDSRHNPTANDMQIIEFLEYYKIPFIIVLTKADKLSSKELSANTKKIKKMVDEMEYASLAVVSSFSGNGIEELREMILDYIKTAE